jgi:hypothetical protein
VQPPPPLVGQGLFTGGPFDNQMQELPQVYCRYSELESAAFVTGLSSCGLTWLNGLPQRFAPVGMDIWIRALRLQSLP